MPKTLNPNTGDPADKAKTYVTPTFPNKHLDAGVKNTNDYDPGEKYTTEQILGEMSVWPKPISGDKSWKIK